MVRTLHCTDSRRKLFPKINETEPNGKINQKEFPPRIELGSPESESGMLTTTSWEQFEATGKQGHMIELAIVAEIWDHVLHISRICPVQNVPSIGSQTLFFSRISKSSRVTPEIHPL